MRVLTFDIEDWFHILNFERSRNIDDWSQFPSRVEEGTLRLLNLLDDHDVSATFFVLGWVAEKFPMLVREIVDRGHHIGTHSYGHQLVYEQNPREFEYDLQKSIDIITRVTEQKVDAYRAPGFSINKDSVWAFEILAKHGIIYDCSIFSAKRAHGGDKSFGISKPCRLITASGYTLIEFPMSTIDVFNRKIVITGGGYFRICPKLLIRKQCARQDYTMTYFHPRDFDPEQPMLDGLGAIRKFKSYVGLRSSFKKLDTILSDFQFLNLSSAAAKIGCSDLPEYKL